VDGDKEHGLKRYRGITRGDGPLFSFWKRRESGEAKGRRRRREKEEEEEEEEGREREKKNGRKRERK
jgi:hypothetical protein